MILVALAALGAAAVAFVLYPVFGPVGNEIGESPFDEPKEPEEFARERIELEEKKTRLYESLTDLDFERDAGKVSPADYETARNDYLAQVSAVLTRLDELSPKKARKKKAPAPETRRCSNCSEPSPKNAKFCVACGAPVEAVCDSCGETLPAAARFCPGCGKKIQ